MSELHDANRRMLLTALAGLTLSGAVLTPAVANTPNRQNNSRTLVVYFSRSGNTRVIAGVIHRHLNADLFEIEPATAYPDDYFQTVQQAKNQHDQGVKPALKHNVTNFERYHTIYLGFPIWGTSVPPVVQTFLSSHDFSSKLVIPFITHGGYGIGNSEEILAGLAAAAKRENPLVIECDQERKTTEIVTNWLAAIRHQV
ncbi:flavodoxin [Erwinia pyrifoliae]|uniref:Flavodoxin n=1 Tax=Erwinia pyrifoliae TaxID=79967 RepID=A0ABY5X6X5_ERWPY|nr:flavodoxin [Erwinia pyrifoliae]AUX71559.1 flavodoxin [Erwinia pyrifoliae]MCA8878218.1 flavodoxin [Erwinia pyrifoliae]MCT2386046.1 flavodoxin [Erwinia pyrifoliae]MCU8588368.1 flavodoxin [Erwinia pyrifoliae]UWS29885.1 flavodoxin [Erwinia pyrifoliae]